MEAVMLLVAVLLCALIGWYGGKGAGLGGHDQIDVDRSVKVFLSCTTLLFLGLYAAETWRRDDKLDRTLDVVHSVAAYAERCGLQVDSARLAVDEVIGSFGP